jgi:hypothetical protein
LTAAARAGLRSRAVRAAVQAAVQAALQAAVLAGALWAAVAGAAETAADADYLYTSRGGDTLIGLGRRFLAEPARWPEIARANALPDPNRIATGALVRIPLRLMRTQAVPVTLLGVVGEARGSGPGEPAAPLQTGQTVAEGGEISTGADGHVTLRLVDGTLLRLRPASRLQLNVSRQVRETAVVRSGARLQQGRVEVEAAPAAAGRPGFRIETPQGVLAVRGTEFRVASDGDPGPTRGEVLGGAVGFEGRAGTPAQPVAAGFGAVIDAAGRVAPPVRLLDAPDTRGLPALQERLLMRFELPPIAGAAAYRGQISSDASFDHVLADLSSPTPELRFAELPDGDYLLRARGIDAQGLEGRDADHRFRLKARPEAPLPAAPAPGALMFGGRVEFAWAASPQADSYRLQLAASPALAPPLRDLAALRELRAVVEGLAPGAYHWRLASVRADGDQGPWGVVGRFELRPLPPEPKPPEVGDSSVRFAWEAAPGQTFEFQLARDPAFADRLLEKTLDRPGVELPLPGSGRFWVRLRARDPDGFLGPYTTPQYFDLPNCLRIGGLCARAGGQTLNLKP